MNKYEIIRAPSFEHDEIAFEYVMAVNRAPMWVKRGPFLKEVGIDQVFAPFQCDDVDGCLRAWRAGWRVGLYSAKFSHPWEGGMRLFNANRVPEQASRNWKIVYQRHMNVICDGALSDTVAEANRKVQEYGIKSME